MFTAQLVDYNQNGREVLDTRQFETLEEFNAANQAQTEIGTPFWECDSLGQCEMCDRFYFKSDAYYGGRTGKAGFCSKQCKDDADEEIHYWNQVDREENRYGDHDHSMDY
jgi:hypothetical protein